MSKVISVVNVEQKIFYIRGQKVMFDRDLASLYGVPTKRLNEQVRRNIKRFPSDFMFQLDQKETEASRSQFATLEKHPELSKSSQKGRHSKYLPAVFTEQGIAMLSGLRCCHRCSTATAPLP